MEIYLVGGAIRDELLGLPVKERDWVVVGGSPEELIKQGFQPVGKDFPVFLHPKTHEEYALARTERKTAKGYKGFAFYAAPDVTLEDDLKRRDLTINAMAQSSSGELIDPFGGQEDLQRHLLRHVSLAFAEDPVRILRGARIATKLTDFDVYPETNELMRQMVKEGEVDALVAERVWQEFERALQEKKPQRFFKVLENCNALTILFPEINLKGAGTKALISATDLSQAGPVRFAALCHDISDSSVKKLCQRVRAPREYADLAILVSKWYSAYTNILTALPEDLLHLLKSTDAFRRPNRFQYFLLACRACIIATDNEPNAPRDKLLQKALKAVKAIDIKPLLEKDLKGQAFADELYKMQIATIKEMM